jgi:subtilisin family serine protease
VYRRIARLLFALSIAVVGALPAPTTGLAQTRDPRWRATALLPDTTFRLAAKKANGGSVVGVIVKLRGAPLASYAGGVPGLAPTSPRATGARRLDVASSNSQAYLRYLAQQQGAFEANARRAVPQAQVTNRLDVVLNAVAMQVPAAEVRNLASLPDVLAVYPDELLKPDTDRSPTFIGAPTVWKALGGQESAGEGVIVGVLDTGIWPEHPSFADPDTSGKPYPAPPPPTTGTRACEFSGGANPGPAFACNNKLIGADRFMASYDALVGLIPGEFTTARDDNGHGSHTASTAAGNAGVAASIFGVSRGTISGIAPRAHVMAYKVCGESGCLSSDSAAAVQEAIRDGVDVINFSISGGNNPYSDAVELAFLDAYNAGIFVATSAGNSGPAADTVNHRAPWVTSVAATTHDRAFVNKALVTAPGGASLTLDGTSLTPALGASPLVSAGDAPYSDPYCVGPFPAGTFTGKVVICKRGAGIGRAQKGFNIRQAGAAGMILYNDAPTVTDLETDNHYLPTSHIQFAAGQTLLSFLAAHPGAQASLTAGAPATAAGDVMASFSSRGGPDQSLGVSKPDVAAPGVQILAGHAPQHVDVAGGPPGELFQAIAGTSMSSPHVAGAAALLADLQPSWTPGQIKSALMTTADTDVVKEDGSTSATPFDRGSGRIDLTRAANPGLTIDESGADYLALQTNLWNANYPSVYVPAMPGAITVQRTVHSLLPTPSTWDLAIIGSPSDVKIKVPDKLLVAAGGDATFDISIEARDVPIGQARHATLRLSRPGTTLQIPISFVRRVQPVALSTDCAPASIPLKAQTTCTITAVNSTFSDAKVTITDQLPKELQLVPGSITGGATPTAKGLSFSGTLAASQPPSVAVGPGSSPAGGYLPLSLFGIPPIAGVTDDSITNFNVPSFLFGGEVYTRLGVASNGYVVVGGGTGADVSINNQSFPTLTRPNNVLAPFWTDLNPAAAGAVRIGTLTDGSDTWIIVDWEGVREFSLPKLASFQIWIGVDSDANPAADVSYAFGTIQGNGDGGFLSVGAENRFGNRGQNTYFNGSGTLPANGTQLRVTTTPGTVTNMVITFKALGDKIGQWVNYAEMTSDAYQGKQIARAVGEVTK